MTCSAEARPEPSYKIFFNETILVKSDKMYAIPNVKRYHVGYYKCVANNILGKVTSNSEYLRIEGKISLENTI